MSNKLCGLCGQDLKCLKTGLTVHHSEYMSAGEKYSADLHGCKKCKTSVLVCNSSSFFSEQKPDVVVIDGTCFYDAELFEMWEKYYPDWNMQRMFTPKAVLGERAKTFGA